MAHGPVTLYLVRIDALDLFGLDAQVGKGLSLRRVVEANHQFRDAAPEGRSLMKPPSLPEGVASVIAGEIDRLTPLFDQAIYRRNGQGAALPGKDRFVVPVVPGLQKPLDRIDAGLVETDTPALMRFPLSQLDLVHLLQVSDLPDGDPQKVRGPEIRVYPDYEKGEVAGTVGQKFLSALMSFSDLIGSTLISAPDFG